MEKEILTMEEAAEFFSVSVKTFIKLLKEEKVPARKIGREWRFSKKALIEWLSTGDSQAYTSSEGDTREFFDELAPSWEEISKGYYDESIKNKLTELKVFDNNMTVVDLGCGDGYISRSIAGNVSKVVAVDISKEMLRELEKKAAESGITNIKTLETQAEDIPIDDASVDVVCANMFLHHIEEPEIAIKEMYRVVKSGGKAVVSDFLEHTNKELREKMHDIWLGFSKSEMKKWFKEAGFNNIKVHILAHDGMEAQPKNRLDVFILTGEK